MRAAVLFATPSGDLVELGPGDIIGRLWSAMLQVDDARVSEAHAMVSLRGGELKLLALRAKFAVHGKPLREVTLSEGQSIELARGLALMVVEVQLPSAVLVLEMEGLGRQPLPGACWLVTTPHPRLVSVQEPGALAAFWSTGSGWKVKVGDQAAEELIPGWTASFGGVPVTAVLREVARASGTATRLGGRVDGALRVLCHFDTVVIERDGVMIGKLTGQLARLVCELAEIGEPVEWEPLARSLWPDEIGDKVLLRKRWDTAVYRLRGKLAQAGLRTDLVVPDGGGKVLLHLRPGDEVELGD